MYELWEVLLISAWGFIGLFTLLSQKSISKFDYSLVWIVMMANMLSNYYG